MGGDVILYKYNRLSEFSYIKNVLIDVVYNFIDKVRENRNFDRVV